MLNINQELLDIADGVFLELSNDQDSYRKMLDHLRFHLYSGGSRDTLYYRVRKLVQCTLTFRECTLGIKAVSLTVIDIAYDHYCGQFHHSKIALSYNYFTTRRPDPAYINSKIPSELNNKPLPKEEEDPMPTETKLVEHITFIKGVKLESLTDAQIFNTISEVEAKIKTLQSIERKPKRLTAQIAKLEAELKELITVLDEADAKS